MLTPALDGADGISELSRQVIATLVDSAGPDRVEVWALEGGNRPLRAERPSRAVEPVSRGLPRAVEPGFAPSFRTGHGRRARMVRWTLARAVRPLGDLTVVVMHAHLAPLAGVLALRGARFAIFLIGVEVWSRLRRRERRAIERADHVIAISKYTARRFREANPQVSVRSLTVCPLGVGPAPAGGPSSVEAGFALIVGRLWAQERYKGHDRLIDIWPSVRARVPDARLMVVGDGDDRRRLEARVAESGLTDAIRFAGRVGDEALAGLYRDSAFFVMPSTSEGFGLAYLEAMRAGKPCVALHGSADEIIDAGVHGIVIDETPAGALTEAIVRLFTDRELRTRMGAAAAARVARQFTGAHFAQRLRAALGLSPGSASVSAPRLVAAPQTRQGQGIPSR